jgi:ArsR family transcriptional regulator
MRKFMAITKALSDPNRVRVLLALRVGELCVCQITELLGLATSTISKHLSILNQAGLILSRKAERWVYYRLPDKSAPVEMREALDWVMKSLGKTDEAMKDAVKLKKILKIDPAVLMAITGQRQGNERQGNGSRIIPLTNIPLTHRVFVRGMSLRNS